MNLTTKMLTLNISTYLSIYLSIFIFISIYSIYLSIRSIYLSIFISFHLYIHLSIYLSIYFIFLVSIYLYIYLSIYLSIYLYCLLNGLTMDLGHELVWICEYGMWTSYILYIKFMSICIVCLSVWVSVCLFVSNKRKTAEPIGPKFQKFVFRFF